MKNCQSRAILAQFAEFRLLTAGQIRILFRVSVFQKQIGEEAMHLGIVRRRWIGTSALALALSGYSPAQAQGAPAGADSAEPVNDIVVTGSRIARDGASAPTPVTVIGADYMAQRAQTNVADTLNELPSFRPAQTPAGSSNRSQVAGSNFVDLRGLGSARTLTLIDGKRFVPSAGTGQIDLNNIPSILIDRTEVVTGGASASYGSDAVAGVVNLVLKKDFTGIQGEMQYGQSQKDDANEYRAALLVGGSLLDDRLHLMAAGEFYSNDGVGDQYTRDWGRKRPGLVVNPVAGATPTRVITNNVHDSRMTDGGLITSGLTWGSLTGTVDPRLIQFSADGTPAPFTVGQSAGSQLMIGGDGDSYFYRGFALLPRMERKIGYGRIAYDVSDSLRIFGDFSYSDSQVNGQSANAYNYGNLTLSADNAYLPASVRSAMVANGLSTVSFGRWSGDIGQVKSDISTKTLRTVVGIEGSLGADWTFDGYYEYGRTRYTALLTSSRQPALFRQALDAVVNPATGNIVCRIALTNPSTACQPFNPFGVGNFDADSVDYFTGTQVLKQTTEENVVSANIQGSVLQLPAGPLKVAFGAEYRTEKANSMSDAASQASLWEYGNPKPLNGSYNVKEAYGEINVPVLRDAPFARSLDLSGAFRYTDYSTSGGVQTWKVGAEWQVADFLRFRATRSRDIRAPNIAELFTPSVLGPNTLRDPQTGASYFVNGITSGNANLKPEKADTLTAGVILTPDSHIRLAVDYFDIKINDAISTLALQSIIDRCYNGETALCAQVVRNSSNVITDVTNRYINIASLKNRGIDIEFSYRLPLDEISSLPGTLSFRNFATHTIKYTTSDGLVTTRLDGQAVNTVASVPSWVVNTNLSYEVGRFQMLAQGRFISAGKYDNAYVEGVNINDNSIPSRFYVNLSAQYKLLDSDLGNVEIFAVINNLMDKDPPLVPVYGVGATNFAYYDVIGRSGKVGVRFKF
ncbi:TonB-dependent receptor (plasmid) [Novosphingobium sp. P6W]|nr:TonB-dependent receptor [Novosphingobium sp. P6W]